MSNKYVVMNGQLYQRADTTNKRVVAAIWKPSKGESEITSEMLLDSFPELSEEAATALAEAAENIHDGNFSSFLRKADEAIGGHGVEPLALGKDSCKKYDIDWDDREIAYYVNTGDTYSATLIYDPEDNRVYLTTWGDWLQAWEYEKDQEMAEEEAE